MAREHWTWLRVPRQLNGRTSTGTWAGHLAPPRQCLVQVSGFQHAQFLRSCTADS